MQHRQQRTRHRHGQHRGRWRALTPEQKQELLADLRHRQQAQIELEARLLTR
jgi:predicted Fe-S protein YdhL (DUF1289 family)